MSELEIPTLEGEAAEAVSHRGSHVQIIASAGSGKTEVVSQRVASLLAEGVNAREIVAFTFTERAAEELKNRIARRVEQKLGKEARDLLGGLYVGTIHGYCFQLLQSEVPKYETFDVLDDKQLTAFLAREATRLEIKQLDPAGRNRTYVAISEFLRGVDVVENEMLDPQSMPEPFRTVLLSYIDTLERYRLLTFGQQIGRAVVELEKPEIQSKVQSRLKHLIVDEYQDVNPAQERLVELLAGPDVQICVVGDDDQAIYQWRGSDVGNIVGFADRFANVSTFTITTNRRSRPQIIERANSFAKSIPNRLDKEMKPFRPGSTEPEIVTWVEDLEMDEAGWIAQLILDLNEDHGIPFRDIAILVRSSSSYPKLLEQFRTFDVPIQPSGRTGLFGQPEAIVLGKLFCWLRDVEWRVQYQPSESISDDSLLTSFESVFKLSKKQRKSLGQHLLDWKTATSDSKRKADLVHEFYQLLEILEVSTWDLSDSEQVNRIGTLARFSSLLADYEAVRRRARPDSENDGEQVGGQDRGHWYYQNLATLIVNYANGAYEGFDGEDDFELDAVDLLTVHRSKGLEWPVVFVPSLTANRFPSAKTGKEQPNLVPRDRYPATRYEGSDADERRLFYVAATRSRDWLSLSRHDRPNKQKTASSPYWEEFADLLIEPDKIKFPEIEPRSLGDGDPLTLSFSELSLFIDCGLSFRLRNILGFEPRLAAELGYGKAVHHILRSVADFTTESGKTPTDTEIDQILDSNFFLATANKVAHREMKKAARGLVVDYVTHHESDLFRIWESERAFELHLDGVTISGRADVILDREGGKEGSLAILDYKTSVGEDASHALQLQVYTDAGRREGLDVSAAYVHDLKKIERTAVDVSAQAVTEAEVMLTDAASKLRGRQFDANPGKNCRSCDVRAVCGSAKR
jgi:DNA helicase-2/ATP-dependent DNA helicase PcrA